MAKIKYQGGLTKLIASKIGEKNKKKFAALLADGKQFSKLQQSVKPKGRFDCNVVSFSSCRDFSEQVLSILSFLKYVGAPSSWTVYSDGSHTEFHINFLKDNFGFVQFAKVDFPGLNVDSYEFKPALAPYKEALADYAKAFPLGKKLFYYLQHDVVGPTVFIDSDVLFYHKADALHNLLLEDVEGWFLPDTDWNCLDSRYKTVTVPQMYQANSGFIFVKKAFGGYHNALEFLKSTQKKYEYFTEQTVLHILINSSRFMPVDPRIFILNSGDQFDFSYLYPPENIALRHYTGPVRHKMWQKNFEWHLSIKRTM